MASKRPRETGKRGFQSKFIKRLESEFPGCKILKNDANYLQGIPDLTVFYGPHWAVLECKAYKDAEHQPNQDDYVAELDRMSFSRFVYPENEEETINGLRSLFQA